MSEPTEFDAKAALRNIPNNPGVYRMLDEKGVTRAKTALA